MDKSKINNIFFNFINNDIYFNILNDKKIYYRFFYYRNKYYNNIEIGRILLEHSERKWREKNRKDSNKFQGLLDNIDLSTKRYSNNSYNIKDNKVINEGINHKNLIIRMNNRYENNNNNYIQNL